MSTAESPQGVPYSELPHFINKDGLHIYTRCWEPEEGTTPRGIVLVLHGLGEHCGRYDTVAEPLVGTGMVVFAHDHVGHGQSEGIRVDIKDFHIYIRDTLQHVDIITEKYPGLPLFLIGHSMGGTIAILSALERPEQFAGVVLIAPAVKANPETATTCLLFLAKVAAFLFPQLQLDSIKAEHVSRDPKEVELYNTDPLIWHGGIKARFAVQILRAFSEIEARVSEITWPFLVQQGDKDKLVEVSGATFLAENAPSKDKRLQMYPDHFHALHREPPEYASVVIQDLTSWIAQRLEQAPSKPEDVQLRE